MWKKCYAVSSRDHGTLGHFCSLLGRLPKAKKPKENMNACVDILFTVLKGYYIASACKKLGIANGNDIPPNFPSIKSREEKYAYRTKLARQVVEDTTINQGRRHHLHSGGGLDDNSARSVRKIFSLFYPEP